MRWGVGASEMRRGLVMGVPRPCPSGYRLSPVRRWGCAGRRGLLVSGGGPALAGRAIRESPLRRGVGELGMRWGLVGGAPPGAPLDTGFRRYDDGGVGAGECCWCRGAPFECPQDRLRQAQGERSWEARVRWGLGDAMVGDGDAPRRAPALGSRFRENDDRGMGVGECCWCRAGGPALAGRAIRESPLRWSGVHEGGVPACPGATRAGGPSTGSGRTDSRIAPTTGCGAHEGGVPACAGTTGGGVGGGRGMPTTSAARKTGRPCSQGRPE